MTIRLITGLHIGGSDDTMQIGGIDKAVVKREVFVNDDGSVNYNGRGKKISEPYIPGSSLKGKIRSLLEVYFGLIDAQIKIYKNEHHPKKRVALQGKPIDSDFIKKSNNDLLKKKADLIITLFGESAGSGDTANLKITRAIFRDAFLTEQNRRLYLEDKLRLSEEKAENSINRVNMDANPRFLERVPAGLSFNFEVLLRKFEEDTDRPLMETLRLGLLLLENDALGGGGSRGNGRVEFVNDIKEGEVISHDVKEERDIDAEIKALMKVIKARL